MSTLTTHTTASRDTHSIGLCKFNTTSKAIEVSDGTNWLIYDYNNTTEFNNRYTLSFDGTNDYASTGYNGGSTTAISLSFWTKSSNTNAGMAWISNSPTGSAGGGFRIIAHPTTKAFFVLVDNSTSRYVNASLGGTNSTLAIRDGNWHHVVMSISGTSIKLWIDGGSGGNPTYTDTSTVSYVGGSTTNYHFGRNGDNASYYLDGQLDDISIFEYELSAQNVSDIYNSGTPVFVDDRNLNLSPVGYWRGGDDGDSGTTITDQGSGGNNATLQSGASIISIATGESIYV